MKRRVLHLSLRADPLTAPSAGAHGTQQALVRSVVRGLQQCGFGVDVLTASSQEQQSLPSTLGHMGRVSRLMSLDGLEEAGWQTQFPSLTEEASAWVAANPRRHYHLVHSHYWVSGAVGGPLAHHLGVPWIHSPISVPAGGPALEIATQQWLEADAVVVPTPTMALAIAQLAPGARLRVVSPGVDPQMFFPRDAGPALRKLGLGKPGLLGVTDGEDAGLLAQLMDAWVALLRDRRIPEECHLLLPRPDVTVPKAAQMLAMRFQDEVELARLYTAARVALVLGTGVEARVGALQAMAAGMPVVTAKASAAADLVVDGETGRVVDIEDPTSLLMAAVEVWLDPVTALRLGRAAESHILNQYTESHQATEMARLYEEVDAGATIESGARV